MDSIVVTGGAGFIGSNFVRLVLRRTRASVVVFDALTYAGCLRNLDGVRDDERLTFLHADIRDRRALDAMFGEHRPRWIVNFAAESHVDRSIDGPRDFLETNVCGTFELLDAVRVYAGGLPAVEREGFRCLHVSTDEVYGSAEPGTAFREDDPYAPNSPYAASKAAADHFVRAYARTYHLPLLLTNCTNNYGPYQHPEKLIPLMILNAVQGRSLPIYGDGRNVREWLYVEDHCDGLLRVLEQGRCGRRYNIGGEERSSNIEVVDCVCAALEDLYPARENPAMIERGIDAYTSLKSFVVDRPGHDRRYALDASRVRNELHWTPRSTFAAGMAHTVRWYLEHRDWVQAVEARGYKRERLGLAGGGPS